MTENWKYYPCMIGDDVAFIYLNVGASDAIDSAPKDLAKIRLAYKSPREDGLPTSAEFDAVSAIEDRIEEFAGKAADWYVGRITVAGHRVFYVYTHQAEKAWKTFVDRLAEDTGYQFQLAHSADPEHKGYREELYPTEDDWQVIEDLRVIEQLENRGDAVSQPRKVEHWAYFKDEASASAFAQWAAGDRFTLAAKPAQKTQDGTYRVRLFHHGTMQIDDISSHTIALRRKAAELGGEYDGWESPVVESPMD